MKSLNIFFSGGGGGEGFVIDIILCKVQSTGLTHPRTISNQAPCSREVEKRPIVSFFKHPTPEAAGRRRTITDGNLNMEVSLGGDYQIQASRTEFRF